eukprot:18441_1
MFALLMLSLLYTFIFVNTDAIHCDEAAYFDLDVAALNKCDLFSENVDSISSSNKIFDYIYIQTNTAFIQFDIKIHDICDSQICNIFDIHGNNSESILALSINGEENDFELATYENRNIQQFRNASALLPLDNNYHHINLRHTFQGCNGTQNVFQIDESVYYYDSASIATNLTKYKYQLFMGNAENTLNASVSNVCIKTSPVFDELLCGSKMEGDLLASDITYYVFNYTRHNDTLFVLFDLCDSSYDTYLYLWDIQWNVIQTADDGDCGLQTQLQLNSLNTGLYILGISGYGNSSHHAFGHWDLHIFCSASETAQDDNEFNCSIYDTIYCGDIIDGVLQRIDLDGIRIGGQTPSPIFLPQFPIGAQYLYTSDFYCLDLTNSTSFVYIDACGSDSYTDLEFFDPNRSHRVNGNPSGYCSDPSDMIYLRELSGGQYMITVSAPGSFVLTMDWGWHFYQFDITCEQNIIDDDKYKMIFATASTWFHALRGCEMQFGTSLATIITEYDMAKVLYILRDIYDRYIPKEIKVFIGLYKDAGYDTNWKWTNEVNVTCNHTNNAHCVRVPTEAWFTNISTSPIRMGATLYYDNDTDYHFKIEADTIDSIYWQSQSYLCNAPNNGYKPPHHMSTFNVWHKMLFNVSALRYDNISEVLIFYWNLSAFVVSTKYIHYTDINPYYDFHHHDEWHVHHLSYSDLELDSNQTIHFTQKYAQFESSVHLHIVVIINPITDEYDVLMQINLKHMTTHFDVIPSQLEHEYCMVSTDNYVYIIQQKTILRYQIDIHQWVTLDFADSIPSTCAITNDHQYIYIFGNSDDEMLIDDASFFIIKYTTDTETFQYVPTPNLCSSQSRGSSITARNNKIYIHGCYVASWKTVIFDIDTEQFETVTMNIDIPTIKHIPYYRDAQMAVFEDNVLLLMHTTDSLYPLLYDDHNKEYDSISLYYGITDLISINFVKTSEYLAHVQHIWPSHGLDINYFINDFSPIKNDTYHVYFETNDDYVYMSMMLDTTRDDCICNDSYYRYKCYDCQQHIDLQYYLVGKDDTIDVLHFNVYSHEGYRYHILPHYITVVLQRCQITFNVLNRASSNIDPIIYVRFSLSDTCYLRNDTHFSVNITSLQLSISTTLIVHVITDTSTNYSCTVCNDPDCISCNNGNFAIQHATNALDSGTVAIQFESNMIDLRVVALNNTLQYLNHEESKVMNGLFYLYIAIAIVLVTVLMVVICCAIQYMNAFVVDKALILIVAVSQFNDNTELKKLKGVKQNVDDLAGLWRDVYGYDLFISNDGTKQDIIDFIDLHKQRLSRDNGYKSVIVHLISHGETGSILSSNGQKVYLDFIFHEINSQAKHNEVSELTKIIFHHGCQGDVDYNHGSVVSTGMRTTQSTPDNTASATNTAIMMTNMITSTDEEEKDIMIVPSPSNANNIAFESNCVTVCGNVPGRSMSDSGKFTNCICEAFSRNLQKIIKSDFNSLMTEIGRNLEQETDHAELCKVDATLRYSKIRFEKQKHDPNKIVENDSGVIGDRDNEKRNLIDECIA